MGRPRVSEADPLGKAKRGRPSKFKKEETAPKTGFEGEVNAPWRKTVSIFQQTVTLVTSSDRETKKGNEDNMLRRLAKTQKTFSDEKPFPVLWGKSLSKYSAMVPMKMAEKAEPVDNDYIEEALRLGGRLEPAVEMLNEHASTATLCHAIHHPKQIGAFGQKAEKEKLASNFSQNVIADQPMLVAITMSQLNEDIAAQERRVLDARKRLQEVLKHFS